MSGGRPARSSCSGRPSSTAARRRCSRHGSITRSTCTWPARADPHRHRRQGPATARPRRPTARAYALAHGVPARRSSSRTRAGTRSSRSAAWRGCSSDRGIQTRSSCATRPTCCASCGWRRDLGIVAVRVADPDEPDRERPGRELDATIHELGALAYTCLQGLAGRGRGGRHRAHSRDRRRGPGPRSPDFGPIRYESGTPPLAGRIWHLYCAKTPAGRRLVAALPQPRTRASCPPANDRVVHEPIEPSAANTTRRGTT